MKRIFSIQVWLTFIVVAGFAVVSKFTPCFTGCDREALDAQANIVTLLSLAIALLALRAPRVAAVGHILFLQMPIYYIAKDLFYQMSVHSERAWLDVPGQYFVPLLLVGFSMSYVAVSAVSTTQSSAQTKPFHPIIISIIAGAFLVATLLVSHSSFVNFGY